MSLTGKRKSIFCKTLLGADHSKIGFVDVGSGGPLKDPWALVPASYIETITFEPTTTTADGRQLPRCISNRSGKASFNVAFDERSSSLHQPSSAFMTRFAMDQLSVKKTIDVEVTTLDEVLAGHYAKIDAMDYNVEGHDLHALEGSAKLLSEGFVSLMKVEFELTQVWDDQGWFADIDRYLRGKGFELANMEVEYSRPASARRVFHQGEPLWGKGYYVPAFESWARVPQAELAAKVRKAVALYTLADIPGRAIDLLATTEAQLGDQLHVQLIKEQIEECFRYAPVDAAWQGLFGELGIMTRIGRRLFPAGRPNPTSGPTPG